MNCMMDVSCHPFIGVQSSSSPKGEIREIGTCNPISIMLKSDAIHQNHTRRETRGLWRFRASQLHTDLKFNLHMEILF